MKQKRWDKIVTAVAEGRIDEAYFLLRSLVEDGEKAAYREVGNLYEIGGRGIKQDYRKALEWYKKAIEDAEDAYGYYCIAKLYLFGRGVERDYWKALTYFELASEHDIFLADYLLGRIYHFGAGPIEKDIDKASKYYKKAIEQGHAFSIRNLAQLEYENRNYFSWIKNRILANLVGLWIILTGGLNDSRLKQE